MGFVTSARRIVCAAACALASTFASVPAAADAPPEDAAMAESLFREGRALLEGGKVDAACTKLEGSQKLDPKVSTLLNMAACHELQGRTASAWAEFLEAARMARVAPVHDPKALEQVARSRADALAPKLFRLAVDNSDAIPADVELALDGRVIPRAAWSTPLPVDPGERILVARAPDKAPFTAKVTIGSERVHHVTIPALAPAPKTEPAAGNPTPGPQPPIEPEPPPENRFTSAPFLVGAGVAVVGIGVGTFFGARAISLKKERDAECDATGCSPLGLSKQSDAHTAATISTVSFAVGGASAVFALYWALRPAPARRANASSGATVSRLGAGCAGATCAIEVGGSF